MAKKTRQLNSDYTCILCNRKTTDSGHDCSRGGLCWCCYNMGETENEFCDSGLQTPTDRMVREWEIDCKSCMAAGGKPNLSFRSNYRDEQLKAYGLHKFDVLKVMPESESLFRLQGHLTVKQLRAMLFEIKDENSKVVFRDSKGVLNWIKKVNQEQGLDQMFTELS